ncbi:MAG: hypothetical protein P8018_00935 [Acidobacteriota bacterium]
MKRGLKLLFVPVAIAVLLFLLYRHVSYRAGPLPPLKPRAEISPQAVVRAA